ncbi:hypothetical protein C4J81_00340 [Deltaproteobacteria bacterium Smac51]|nr:hypothetical protein C4J81_00260 [Deltaproteobacteria bacterium Smac51]UQZ87747.1 hypothetical protein C4J81_00340 [Deltaproteobacteria bacterium Smac51]
MFHVEHLSEKGVQMSKYGESWKPAKEGGRNRGKILREIKALKNEQRKFERVHNDEGNDEKLDEICLEAIRKIGVRLSELTSQL